MQSHIIQFECPYALYIYFFMLDIRLLQALLVLDDERSVTASAQRQGISQPAMSMTLRRLREQFQDPLFVRTPNGLITTDTADVIIENAREIVEAINTLEHTQAAFSPASSTLELRISASDFALSNMLPNFIGKLATTAPNVTVKVTPLNLETVVTSLENGALDLAVVPEFYAPENMQTRRLFAADFVYLMRKAHPLSKGRITLERLSTCDHLRVAPVSVHRPNRIDQKFSSAGLKRNVRLTVASYAVAFEVVQSTDLILLVPRNAVPKLHDEFAIREVPFDLPPIILRLIWHPKKQNSKAHRWMRDAIFESCARV